MPTKGSDCKLTKMTDKCLPVKKIEIDEIDAGWIRIEYENGGVVELSLHSTGLVEANKFFKELIGCVRQ